MDEEETAHAGMRLERGWWGLDAAASMQHVQCRDGESQ